jgi:hypothetical protein
MALQTSGQARTGITPFGVKKSPLKDNKLPFLAGYLTVLANTEE